LTATDVSSPPLYANTTLSLATDTPPNLTYNRHARKPPLNRELKIPDSRFQTPDLTRKIPGRDIPLLASSGFCDLESAIPRTSPTAQMPWPRQVL
jgi:hypothetical protein